MSTRVAPIFPVSELAAALEALSDAPLVPMLGWDTEGGDRSKHSLLAGAAGVQDPGRRDMAIPE